MLVVRYNLKYRVLDLVGSIYLKLTKIGDAGYYIPKLSSLLIKKVRPYRILEKISPLVYK